MPESPREPVKVNGSGAVHVVVRASRVCSVVPFPAKTFERLCYRQDLIQERLTDEDQGEGRQGREVWHGGRRPWAGVVRERVVHRSSELLEISEVKEGKNVACVSPRAKRSDIGLVIDAYVSQFVKRGQGA